MYISGPCYFQQLSVEIITHVFARLDPTSLATVAKVCQHWRHIATDDTCCKYTCYISCYILELKRKDGIKGRNWLNGYIYIYIYICLYTMS